MLEMPEPVRKYIDSSPDAADIFETAISNRIDLLYDRLKDASPRVLCSEMAKLRPVIKRLSLLRPTGLEKAFRLVFVLGKRTIRPHDINENYAYQREGEDKETDSLLVNLMWRRKDKDPDFMPELTFSQLRGQRQGLEEFPLFHAYFKASFHLMQEWDLKTAQQRSDDIKAHILEVHQTAMSELDNHNPQELLSICPLSHAVRACIPEIRSLGNQSYDKRLLAFDLVLFLGRHSYPEKNRCQRLS